MAWRSNAGPTKTLEERIADLERRLTELEGARPALTPTGGGWHVSHLEPLGDMIRSPWAKGDMAAPALGGEMRAERRGPARPADFMSDVVVPLCWTGVTGLVVGGMFAIVADSLPGWAHGDWWLWFKIGGGLGLACMWGWRIMDHSSLLWLKETVTHTDINGDGNIGRPAAPQPPHDDRIELEVTTRNEKGRITGIKSVDLLDIPYGVLIEFFTGIINGRPLTGPSWEGETGSISQPKFASLMRALESAGLVENKRGNIGRVLTLSGKAVLRHQVEPNPLPRWRDVTQNQGDGA